MWYNQDAVLVKHVHIKNFSYQTCKNSFVKDTFFLNFVLLSERDLKSDHAKSCIYFAN